MTFEFLEQFKRRMKTVGEHALIHKNSMQKTKWKNYGFEEWYESINLIFMVLLAIMEKSLRDEPCTMDYIGEFVDDLNRRYLKKNLSYNECKEVAEFIVNTILCDDGKAMYFEGFNFETEAYEEIHISYIGNKIIYIDDEVKRTSYHLTTEGYNFVLSTLEIESNLKLTIQEMIFTLHLEKANYSQAVDDVKNILSTLRIKLQEIREAMEKIRQYALSYSVEDYKKLQDDTLNALENTKKKYEGYKKVTRENINELEQQHINVKKLDEAQSKNLTSLRTIEKHLTTAIEEQQKILGMHFDLKSLYEKELKGISEMTLIKRFSLEKEVYNKLLKDVSVLEGIDEFLRPLFNKNAEKIYNINLAYIEQKLIRTKKEKEEDTFLSFEESDYEEEKLRKKREKIRLYKESIRELLKIVAEAKEISLENLKEMLQEGNGYLMESIIPTIEIFREVMIEFIKAGRIEIVKEDDVDEDKYLNENQYIQDEMLDFQLKRAVNEVIEEDEELKDIRFIEFYKAENQNQVVFTNLKSENSIIKQVKCTNVVMRAGRI